MEITEESSSRGNGVIVFITLALAIFSTDCTPQTPTPWFIFSLKVIDHPLPLTPSVTAPHAQLAGVNSDFRFNLIPLIDVSQPEFSYQIYNLSHDISGETNDLVGTNQRISGLPNGIIPISREPGDCPLLFVLSYATNCRLRFYVDRNSYVSLQNGHGPVATMHMSWLWGSKKNRAGDEIINIFPSQNLASLLAPIMLPTQIHVAPAEQNGLYYDAATSSIMGNPIQTGDYHFAISASIGNNTASPKNLTITVGSTLHNTPIFRSQYSLASAMPEQEYRLNLMDLIESKPGFAVNNQVRFRILPESSNALWLSLDKDSSTLLHGHPPSTDAGQIKVVTLIATSNSGGDSLPMTIQIPVAFDPEKKPVIQSDLEWHQRAGEKIHTDLQANIADPTTDGSLMLVLDKIEPAAPWLAISLSKYTEITGIVPNDMAGKLYQITLHANNAIGGNSDPVTIPLKITRDENKTPQFKSVKPQLPILYAGQPYFYDFASSTDIIPEYKDIPYSVELAKNYNNPAWLRLEENKLIADKVPEHLNQDPQIFITIKNIPGGKSKVITIDLFLMN